MSQSKTDKIRERLEDYGATQNGHDAAFVSGKLANALEAVVEELSKQQAHSNRWSDEYREAQELLDIIADELNVEES